ncbi:hypothetical protein BGX27_001153 [Mortierella sp. AM989]|nr:hypothetical protein BGX27_001153 [Mortierella sp. AM989]
MSPSNFLQTTIMPQSPRVHPASNFGTNSLFLTDYEKHEWLGSGQQYTTVKETKKNKNGDLVANNETSSSNFSYFQQEMPLTPRPSHSRNLNPSFPDSGYELWCPDTEGKENISPREALKTQPTSQIGSAQSSRLKTQDSPSAKKTEAYLQAIGAGEELPPSFVHSPVESPMQLEDNAFHSTFSSIVNQQSFGSALNRVVGFPTRYLKVSNAPRNMSIWSAREALKARNGRIQTASFELSIQHNGYQRAILLQVSLIPGMYGLVSPEILKNENEGILAITVTNPRLSDNDMLHLLTSYGDVRSFQTESDGWPLVALVEYYDTRHAAFTKAILQELQFKPQYQQKNKFNEDSLATLSPTPLERLVVASSWLLSPGVHQRVESDMSGSPTDQTCSGHPLQRSISPPLHPSVSPSVSASGDSVHLQPTASSEGQELKISAGKPSQLPELTSCSSISIAKQHDGAQETPSTEKPESKNTGTMSYATAIASSTANIKTDSTSTQNVGDKRTTFMIRNIPNKYTQQMLVDCINETHFGKYDFLYLRMDFKNKCNVGYAFINFINTEVVESFVEEHVGKKWARFNSDKICRLSFAAIQGRHALVDKFRNSRYFTLAARKLDKKNPFQNQTSMIKSIHRRDVDYLLDAKAIHKRDYCSGLAAIAPEL